MSEAMTESKIMNPLSDLEIIAGLTARARQHSKECTDGNCRWEETLYLAAKRIVDLSPNVPKHLKDEAKGSG